MWYANLCVRYTTCGRCAGHPSPERGAEPARRPCSRASGRKVLRPVNSARALRHIPLNKRCKAKLLVSQGNLFFFTVQVAVQVAVQQSCSWHENPFPH